MQFTNRDIHAHS